MTFVGLIGLVWLLTSGDKQPNNNQAGDQSQPVPTASETRIDVNIQPTSTLRPWNIPGIPLGSEIVREGERMREVLHERGYDNAVVVAAPNMEGTYQIMVSLLIDTAMADNPAALGNQIAAIVEIVTDAEIGTDFFAIHFLVDGETIRWQGILPQVIGLSGEDLIYVGGPAPTPILFPT
jgi:hypothetical protein